MKFRSPRWIGRVFACNFHRLSTTGMMTMKTSDGIKMAVTSSNEVETFSGLIWIAAGHAMKEACTRVRWPFCNGFSPPSPSCWTCRRTARISNASNCLKSLFFFAIEFFSNFKRVIFDWRSYVCVLVLAFVIFLFVTLWRALLNQEYIYFPNMFVFNVMSRRNVFN